MTRHLGSTRYERVPHAISHRSKFLIFDRVIFQWKEFMDINPWLLSPFYIVVEFQCCPHSNPQRESVCCSKVLWDDPTLEEWASHIACYINDPSHSSLGFDSHVTSSNIFPFHFVRYSVFPLFWVLILIWLSRIFSIYSNYCFGSWSWREDSIFFSSSCTPWN